jgi:hypothetical protein
MTLRLTSGWSLLIMGHIVGLLNIMTVFRPQVSNVLVSCQLAAMLIALVFLFQPRRRKTGGRIIFVLMIGFIVLNLIVFAFLPKSIM